MTVGAFPSRDDESPALAELSAMGRAGLEPVTPILHRRTEAVGARREAPGPSCGEKSHDFDLRLRPGAVGHGSRENRDRTQFPAPLRVLMRRRIPHGVGTLRPSAAREGQALTQPKEPREEGGRVAP